MKRSRFSSVVLKVASRCNINCTYCYMYNKGDNSYMNQPKFMDQRTVDSIIQKIHNHCLENQIENFNICFHGGEPLLAPQSFYQYFVTTAKEQFANSNTNLRFILQTNGILITNDWCNLFNSLGIQITFSLDGYKAIHDKYRIDFKGKGTYNSVIRGLDIFSENNLNNENFRSVLTVINPESDASEMYNHYIKLKVKWLDLLLPDTNYDETNNHTNETPFGDWLIEMFDLWFNHKDKSRPQIRLFQNIIGSIFGKIRSTDALGQGENEILVIETDGRIEAVDVLKTCGESFTKNNLNINKNNLSEAFDDILVDLYYNSHNFLSGECEACILKYACGGGYLPHRYSRTNGFNNKSIYCKDLFKLMIHIRNCVTDTLPEEFLESENISKFSFEMLWKKKESTVYGDSKYKDLLESF